MPKVCEFFGIEIVFNYRGSTTRPIFMRAMEGVKVFSRSALWPT
jgi:hypothetical protein